MHRVNFLLKLGVLFVVFGLFVSQATVADELYGRIRGRATDATGASVPNVSVIATNTETGISKSTSTEADGIFEFLNLPIGTYKVTATKAGFKTFSATGITLTVHAIYLLNAPLDLGQLSEQVIVEAAPAQVETTSMQLGTAITAKTIMYLPLNWRNWLQFEQLQPGAIGGASRFVTGT